MSHLNLLFMQRNVPFLANRVHYDLVSPSLIIEKVEQTEDNCEVVRHYDPKSFYDKYPLEKIEYSLQALIDAGVPLDTVPTALYNSRNEGDMPSQRFLYGVAERIVDSQDSIKVEPSKSE